MIDSNKDKVYLDILLAAGPDPSMQGLKKVFELMAYSSEERSDIIMIFEKVRQKYFLESKGLIDFGGIFLNMKGFVVHLTVLFCFILLMNVINVKPIYLLISAFLVMILINFIFPQLRPIDKKTVWKRSVSNVFEKDYANDLQ
jgi:hypothetical protein